MSCPQALAGAGSNPPWAPVPVPSGHGLGSFSVVVPGVHCCDKDGVGLVSCGVDGTVGVGVGVGVVIGSGGEIGRAHV